MPLDPDKIKQLIAMKNAPRKKGGGGRKGKGKGSVDTSVRTIETWFALHHRFYDNETKELIHCGNPDCIDPRDTAGKGIMVVEVDGAFMCRYCFLENWAAPAPIIDNPAQQTDSP